MFGYGIYVKFTRCTYNSGSIQFNKKNELSPGNPSSLRGRKGDLHRNEQNNSVLYWHIVCWGKVSRIIGIVDGKQKAHSSTAWDLWNSMNNIMFSIHNCLTRFVSMNSISNDSLGCSQLLSHTFPYRSPKLPPFQSPAETNATNFGMEFSFCQGRSRLRKLGFDKDLGFL